jgi:hypothetical protein
MAMSTKIHIVTASSEVASAYRAWLLSRGLINAPMFVGAKLFMSNDSGASPEKIAAAPRMGLRIAGILVPRPHE